MAKARIWIRRRKNRKGKPWICAWNTRAGVREQRTLSSEEAAQLFAADKIKELATPCSTDWSTPATC